MNKKVTMESIARLTGLSKYAVSRALSRKPGVSVSTMRKVMQAADELGYQKPAQKKDSLLLVIPKSDYDDAVFWMEVVHGIEEYARPLYSVYINAFDPENIPPEPIQTDAKGIIYAGYKTVELIRRRTVKIPSVLISHPPKPLDDIDCIYVSDREGGYAICSWLIQRGHKSIAFYGSTERPSYKERFLGMQQAMADANLCFKSVWTGDKGGENSVRSVAESISRMGEMPTAVMCINDSQAIALLLALSGMGISAPRNISITGYDSSLSSGVHIPIAGISIDKKSIGKQAVRMLVERINDPGMPYRRVEIVPQLFTPDATELGT